MKNVQHLLILAFAASLVACSSGTTTSPTPSNYTGVFSGSFTNTPDTQSGSMTLNIAENIDGTAVNGNMIFDSERENCLVNATISESTINGFSITIIADQSTSSRSGSSTTDGSINIQLTQSNSGNNLDGTYVTTGNQCSNSTGSGVLSLVRG